MAVYYFCLIVGNVLFHLFYRFHTIGHENLPKDRGYVLCANHRNNMDGIFIVFSRYWGRRMWIMAKEELFSNPVLSWYLRQLGLFPIKRGAGDRSTLDRVIEKVKGGDALLIFPEGTRNRTEQDLLPFKSGAFVVAQQANADIVPCRVLYGGGKHHPFCRVTVVYGKPIPIASLGLEGEHSASKLRAAKAVLTQRLTELHEQYADCEK